MEPEVLAHVLIGLGVVAVAARCIGLALKAIGQPQVIGEVLAGILLGPSLLGRLIPKLMSTILPPQSDPFLGILAQIGLIVYMFQTGLHLDLRLFRHGSASAVLISQAGIFVPFTLGLGLSSLLYRQFTTRDVNFTNFAIFIGIAMSITAFPVLVRIIRDGGMEGSRIGTIAITCAAVGDLTGWCSLAFLSGLVSKQESNGLDTLFLCVGFLLIMLLVVRSILLKSVKYIEKRGSVHEVSGMIYVLLLLCAALGERIGIHALFGAFLLGTLFPKDGSAAMTMIKRTEPFVTMILLPAYFALTGIRTQLGLITTLQGWIYCGAIILVASIGKFGATTVAGRLTGLRWSEAAAVGVLMNTRGLMELIALNIGLDLHIISPTLFAMFVIMSIGTTVVTAPILKVFNRKGSLESKSLENLGTTMSIVGS